jgi:fumarate reductase flavoprotein subunit
VIQQATGEWTAEIDVAVLGAGGCGLAAALASAVGDRTVFVFEKLEVPLPNTTRSTGMIPAAGSRWQRAAGVDDTPQVFAADIQAKAQGSADKGLVDRLTSTSGALVEWLADTGEVQLELVRGFRYPGHSRERMHAPADRSGATLMRDLRRSVEAAGVDIVLGAPATDLITDPTGAVVGVEITHGGIVERVKADAVVLATNGFGANRDMLRQYCPEIADAPYLGGEGSTGEAMVWGEALGAESAFMDAYQGHASIAVPHNVLLSWSTVMSGGVLVDVDGHRFGDEAAGYSEYARAVLARPGGVAWLVLDGRIHREALAFEDYRQAVEAGALKRADSVSELASRLGLDAQGLMHTIESAALVASGAASDQFGRRSMRELVSPYYGVKVTGALFHTQGGLQVDEHARVVRPDRSPIPGLYAGGGAAVGLSGHGADGYMSGNGLLSAFGLGWLAGSHAAGSPIPV